MNPGDMVVRNILNPYFHRFFTDGRQVGIVLKLTEPTPLFPYQVATVLFASGEQEELATTFLKLIHNPQD